jgi:hypothetical protein
MKRVLTGLSFLAVFAAASLASAQGVQTGTVTGTVQSADGLSLPGVTVTASSVALQGQRTATTDVNGVYFIKGLPPGTYTVTFEITSFKPAKKDNIQLGVGSTVEVGQTMSLGGVTETVNVTAESPKPAALTVPTLSQSYSKAELETLPVGRTPNRSLGSRAGPDSNSPNIGQVNISSATAFDNVFMMNGVDINDNLPAPRTTSSSRRHRADQHPHRRHLGRVRTFLGRRHQRHHQGAATPSAAASASFSNPK